MSHRRSSRLVAALAAAFLVISAVGACTAPRVEAAARDCCKKRCDHDPAGTLRSCCCSTDQAPAAAPTQPQLKPATTSAWLAQPAEPLVAPVLALATARAESPPHCPLFLQRCKLVL